MVRSICAFADLPFEPAMLEFAGAVDVSAKPHHQRLLQPPTRGVRNWRMQMAEADARAFERIAGEPLRTSATHSSTRQRAARGHAARGWCARMGAWNAAAYATQRSPLWRRRHASLI